MAYTARDEQQMKLARLAYKRNPTPENYENYKNLYTVYAERRFRNEAERTENLIKMGFKPTSTGTWVKEVTPTQPTTPTPVVNNVESPVVVSNKTTAQQVIDLISKANEPTKPTSEGVVTKVATLESQLPTLQVIKPPVIAPTQPYIPETMTAKEVILNIEKATELNTPTSGGIYSGPIGTTLEERQAGKGVVFTGELGKIEEQVVYNPLYSTGAGATTEAKLTAAGIGALVGAATVPQMILETPKFVATVGSEALAGKATTLTAMKEEISSDLQTPFGISKLASQTVLGGKVGGVVEEGILTATPIKPTIVKIPTETGTSTEFVGLKFEAGQTAKPLIGVSSEGLVVGKFPEVTTKSIVPKSEYTAPTVFETEMLRANPSKVISQPSTTLVEGKTISAPEVKLQFKESVELERIAGNVQTAINTQAWKEGTATLNPKAFQELTKYSEATGGTIYGSKATGSQMPTGEWRVSKDVDIHFENLKPGTVEGAVPILKAAGEKVRISPEHANALETMRSGQWTKAVEFKGGYEPGQVAPARALGFKLDIGKDTIKVGETPTASIIGESKRKLAASNIFQEGTVGVAHAGRYKDVPDFMRITKAQLEYGAEHGLISKTKAARGMELLSRMEERLGIDLSKTKEPVQFELTRPSPSTSPSRSVGLISPFVATPLVSSPSTSVTSKSVSSVSPILTTSVSPSLTTSKVVSSKSTTSIIPYSPSNKITSYKSPTTTPSSALSLPSTYISKSVSSKSVSTSSLNITSPSLSLSTHPSTTFTSKTISPFSPTVSSNVSSPSISSSISLPSISPSITSPSASISPKSPSVSPSVFPSISPSVSPSKGISPSFYPSLSPRTKSPYPSPSPSRSPFVGYYPSKKSPPLLVRQKKVPRSRQGVSLSFTPPKQKYTFGILSEGISKFMFGKATAIKGFAGTAEQIPTAELRKHGVTIGEFYRKGGFLSKGLKGRGLKL